MGYLQYLKDRRWKVMDTSEIVACGAFKPGYHQELGYTRVELRIFGGLVGSEGLRMNLYSDPGYSKLYCQSEWRSLSSIESPGTHYIGWFRFTFDRENLNKNLKYYIGIESQNYTRDSNDRYLAFAEDWPDPKNAHTTAPLYGLTVQLYGYRQ